MHMAVVVVAPWSQAEGPSSAGWGFRHTAHSLTNHSLTNCLRHTVEHFTVFYKSTSRPRYRVARSQCLLCRSARAKCGWRRCLGSDGGWAQCAPPPPGCRLSVLCTTSPQAHLKLLFSKICTSIMFDRRGRQRLQPHTPSIKVILIGDRRLKTCGVLPREGR